MAENKTIKFNSGWCFALVNGRLAEIYFDKRYGIYAHCYIDTKDYSKREQSMIHEDIARYKFSYCAGYYRNRISGAKHRRPSMYKVFPGLGRFRQKGARS